MSYRIKLKKQNEKIVVDEKQQRVECERSYMLEIIGFPLDINIVNRVIRKKFNLHSAQTIGIHNKSIRIRFDVKGTAICVAPDKFDDKKGIRIAAIKANQKAYSKATRIIAQVREKIKEVNEEFTFDINSFNQRYNYLEQRKEMIIKDEC